MELRLEVKNDVKVTWPGHYSGQVFVTRDVYFDEAYHYDKKDLKPQEFAYNEWYKKDDKFFKDLTDILDASKPTSKFNTISCKNSQTYPNFNKLCSLLLLSNIPDSVGHKKDYKNNNTTFKD